MKNKGMSGNGKLEIIVIKNGKFVKLLKNRSLYPRSSWYAAKYKGDFYPVFWNATGEECIDISRPEWMGVTSIPIKQWKNYPYFQAKMPHCC